MEKVFKVTQINTYIKNLFLADYLLNKVQVKGEVSNCKYHSSGNDFYSSNDTRCLPVIPVYQQKAGRDGKKERHDDCITT